MKPAGKVRCNMRTKLAIVPVKFKYCFGGKSPRTSFCNGTVLIAVELYRGGSSETVHPGNPTRPSAKDRSALGERCVSLGPVRAGARLFQRTASTR